MNIKDNAKIMEVYWGGSCDMACDLCGLYEARYGVSSVYWKAEDGHGGVEYEAHETLPRPKDYVTEGFTEAFEKWGYANMKEAVDAGCSSHEAFMAFFTARFSSRKVYVCERETYNDGRQVVAVFSSLADAQNKMREAYAAYHGKREDEDTEWYDGRNGKWGWYDATYPNGFYIDEIELDAWNG